MANARNSTASTEDPNDVDKRNADEKIEGLVIDLKMAIDVMAEKSGTARSLIHELARQLDEFGQCERGEISRKIKELLRDKINEGKVTAKWIEDCLSPEYKRPYVRNKSEVSSLSEGSQEVQPSVESSRTGTMMSVLHPIADGHESSSAGEEEEHPKGGPVCRRVTESDESQVECYEFSLPWHEVRNEAKRVFSEQGEEGRVHFFVVIDSNTQTVVTAGCGNSPSV